MAPRVALEREQYGGVGGDVYLATQLKRRLSVEMYDGNKGRYGFNVNLAQKQRLKEKRRKTDFYSVVVADGKNQTDAGALALLLAWEHGLIVQIIRLTSRYQVRLAVALVWEDASIKVALKPILDWIYDDDESKPSPAAGRKRWCD